MVKLRKKYLENCFTHFLKIITVDEMGSIQSGSRRNVMWTKYEADKVGINH